MYSLEEAVIQGDIFPEEWSDNLLAMLSEMMYTYSQLLMAHQQEVLQW